MKLTTKGRYAVTALLDLALQGARTPIAIGDIASRHSISPAYLERLAGQMRAKGLLKSIRGSKGGYVLGRPAEDITIAQIIESVNEGMDATRCAGKGNCQDGLMCLTHHLWDELNREIFEFLKGITLQALAAKPDILAVARKRESASSIPMTLHYQGN
jgi:Rrf2 family transcriptional regulator, iron-sulfur cluster assembly transcription factor